MVNIQLLFKKKTNFLQNKGFKMNMYITSSFQSYKVLYKCVFLTLLPHNLITAPKGV